MSDSAGHESFLVHNKLKFLKYGVFLSVAATLAYIIHEPIGSPNGGTWLGYTLGGLSAVLCFWLAWFGVRKRQYALGATKMKAWLSAHVYLGLTVLVIASLHSGMQFGLNVHTLTYILMAATILSGVFGVYYYSRYPTLMAATKGSMTLADMMAQMAEVDQEIREASISLPDEITERLMRSANETKLGGNIREKLTSRVADCPTRAARIYLDDLEGEFAMTNPVIRQIVALLVRKEDLLRRARRTVQIQTLLKFWLFFHIPLAVGLLAAIPAHVFAVFFYW